MTAERYPTLEIYILTCLEKYGDLDYDLEELGNAWEFTGCGMKYRSAKGLQMIHLGFGNLRRNQLEALRIPLSITRLALLSTLATVALPWIASTLLLTAELTFRFRLTGERICTLVLTGGSGRYLSPWIAQVTLSEKRDSRSKIHGD